MKLLRFNTGESLIFYHKTSKPSFIHSLSFKSIHKEAENIDRKYISLSEQLVDLNDKHLIVEQDIFISIWFS